MTAGAPSTRGEGRPVSAIVAALVAVFALAQALSGCASAAAGATSAGHSSPSTPHASGTPSPAASHFRSPRTAASVPVPVRLRIPSIGVNARLVEVGLDPDGTIAAPHSYRDAAWYAGGSRPGQPGPAVRPGQPGPAVLLGHVDSKHTGPAVFYRLATLKPGAEVLVDRADKSTVRFYVSGRIQVAKSRFPADLYAPTLAPSLRLVTCGGDFDKHTGHYLDNVVVTALPRVSSP